MIEVTPADFMGSDLTVVDAARVSLGKESSWVLKCSNTCTTPGDMPEKGCLLCVPAGLHKKDSRLIKYLADHKHMSPFGHCFASFHVKAPIFVARQLVKHKFLRWNEISRRYVDSEPEFYVPDVWRGRSKDKKQGSSGIVDIEGVTFYENGGIIGSWYLGEEMRVHWSRSLEQYDKLLKAGVAPEQARMVLPQSTMTEWWWSGSLDAFADMCNLRLKGDTQYETRLVAEGVSEAMSGRFPVSWAALIGRKVGE